MSNLLVRFLSALILIPLVLALVFFSSLSFFVFSISSLAGISGYELGAMVFPKNFRYYPLVTAFLSAALCASVSLFHYSSYIFLFSLTVSCFISFLFFMFIGKSIEDSVRFASFTLFGSVYCGLLFGFMGLIFCYHYPVGSYWLLLLLLGTFLGDTGAYTFGRIFGKTKLAPRLSPKKTWAGAIGGFFCTSLSILLVKFSILTDISWFHCILLSFFLSVSCQLGDLAESFLKRGIGVKDSGHLIPGHGGLLDRVDALLFGAPVVFLFSVLQ